MIEENLFARAGLNSWEIDHSLAGLIAIAGGYRY